MLHEEPLVEGHQKDVVVAMAVAVVVFVVEVLGTVCKQGPLNKQMVQLVNVAVAVAAAVVIGKQFEVKKAMVFEPVVVVVVVVEELVEA